MQGSDRIQVTEGLRHLMLSSPGQSVTSYFSSLSVSSSLALSSSSSVNYSNNNASANNNSFNHLNQRTNLKNIKNRIKEKLQILRD